jgi:YVTN family beta-propeller protein
MEFKFSKTQKKVKSRNTLFSVIIMLFVLSFTINTGSAQEYAYVANGNGSTLHKVDLVTNTIVGSATLPGAPSSYFVAITPDGSTAYTTNDFSDNVRIVDAVTMDYLGEIPGIGTCDGMAITSDGAYGYVSQIASFFSSSAIYVIDLNTNTIATTITIPGIGQTPRPGALTPDGAYLYVPISSGSSRVSVISTATNTIVTNIAIGTSFIDGPPVMSLDGAYVYVVVDNAVKVIETATNTVVNSIAVSSTARAAAISPDGAYLYVPHLNQDYVTIISTTTNSVVNTVNVGDQPTAVAFSSDGSKAFVTNYNSQDISIIETASQTVVGTITGFNNPNHLVLFGSSIPDSDGDGVNDEEDGCPLDPNKVEPGQCGCGVEDVDSDGDGIADCVDNCIETANADQADSDEDGIGDACDACPAIPDPNCATCGNGKYLVCHIPPGNPENAQQLCISLNAANNHIGNHGGCYWGVCNLETNSIGNDQGAKKTSQSQGAFDRTEDYNPIVETENGNAYYFEVSPNPAIDRINIHLHGQSKDAHLYIHDQLGRLVWNQPLDQEQSSFQIVLSDKNILNGTYFVTVRTNGEGITKQVIVLK